MPLRALASIKPADSIRPGALRLSVFDEATSQDIRVGLNQALKGSSSVPVVAKAFYEPKLQELVVAPTYNKSLAKLRRQAWSMVSAAEETRAADVLALSPRSDFHGADVKEGVVAEPREDRQSHARSKTALRELKLARMVDDMDEGRMRRRIERRGGKSNKSLRQIIRLETSQEFSALGEQHFA